MQLDNSRLGLEQEFFIVDTEGFLSNRADEFLQLCHEIAESQNRKTECFAPEFVKSIIEINTVPVNNLSELTQEYLDLLQILLKVADRLDLRLYPLSTYPLYTTPVMRNKPNYHLQVRTVGEGRFDNAAKCTGTHVHLDLPDNVVDRKVGIAYNSSPEARSLLVNIYNLATAFDAAIIALSRACPFYDGKVAGKAMRTIHYRGSDRYAWQGVYTKMQTVGGLLPYVETAEELSEQLFNRYHCWLQAMDRAGVPREMFLDSGGELLTAGWNPIRLNSVGTVELRGMDSNYPELTLSLVALVSEAANRLRREGLTVKPKKGIKTFKLQDNELNVPDFDYLNGELLYAAVTEGVNNAAVRDYLDSIVEFSFDRSELSDRLAHFKTALGEYTTTEAQLLNKFSTTTGEIDREDGLALVRYCCDRLEEEVDYLCSQHSAKNALYSSLDEVGRENS
ncbi:glutamate-cysteine ligase family protein [Myxosarcina sp. GI1]|uniref:glutamate-cysteine ligase family protein n=1 Tax=Myxosarcina sp. GI1 TaxID=1541065 RepID=UPI0005695862|nr:glutamate-cysteine ligase family protein [Myxosarcina sp. GI1]